MLQLLTLIAAAAAVLAGQARAVGYHNTEVPVRMASTHGEPWPAPLYSNMLDSEYVVTPSHIHFRVTGSTCHDLEVAIARYEAILAKMSSSHQVRYSKSAHSNDGVFESADVKVYQAAPNEVELQLNNPCVGSPIPSADMDEAYNITINSASAPDRAIVIADSIWGMYRGLETFVQLIHKSDEDGTFHLRQGEIVDAPRFAHRGLMLDTSRHFLSVDIIKQNIDLMAFNKFNVFHWHIVDDQSFPFESTTFPELSGSGAYSAEFVYSTHDVSEVIEYARLRGIRVIPEFDTPGHTRSWGAGNADLLTKCFTDGKPNGQTGPVDPSKNSTYEFMKDLFTEVTVRFPDSYIHLGGDEVSFGFDCWLSNPDIQAWMQHLGITTPQQIENEYIQRLLDIVANLPTNPQYAIWQEVVDNNITVLPNTIVEVWKGEWEAELARVTSLGHRALLATPWYLNYIEYGADWPKYYQVEPENFNGTDAQRALVMGGEVCMWGEYVDDTNVVPRTWPRAAAVAERLWSPASRNDTDAAAPRIEEHRCRLLRRGYPVQPINGPGFC